jgi:hypothetical protein
VTPRDQLELARLLGKLLNVAHKREQPGVFTHTWKLLYFLGAKVHYTGEDFITVTSSGTVKAP